MDVFEYLPQLIVAYDGDDKFANLIHVKKSEKDKDYFCPCCGGIVKPRALESNKEQSHYYHKTGKCTKESQLHFFCKNWLFETGSKFYIGDELFEVKSIDIEKVYHTAFGNYTPDITVYTTSGKTIYFEMFFSNRKTGDDYFCRWDALGNSVVEVNIKEYMVKTDISTIPVFSYLYHNGVCYSKSYIARDLYANTIAKIKYELTRQQLFNYKARIEQLDWFWQCVRNNESEQSILEVLAVMNYDDALLCYSIIKRKQCVLHLKNDVLNIINQKVITDIRRRLPLPSDENVYFDLKHIRGRTYEAGIRLCLKTEHIIYDDLYQGHSEYVLDRLKDYPKIVFSKNIYNTNELVVPQNEICKLQEQFAKAEEYKKKLLDYENELSDFEGEKYKIKVKNNRYTVLEKNGDSFEKILDRFYMPELDIEHLSICIQNMTEKIKGQKLISAITRNEEYRTHISELENYNGIGCRIDVKYETREACRGVYFKMYFNDCRDCIYSNLLTRESDFINEVAVCKEIVGNFVNTYSDAMVLVKRINNCKNKFWKAKCSVNAKRELEVQIDQKLFNSYVTNERFTLNHSLVLDEQNLISIFEDKMRQVLKNMEYHGYRVMGVKDYAE